MSTTAHSLHRELPHADDELRTAPARLHSRSLTLRWAIRIAITTRRSGSTSEPATSRTSLHRKALPSGRLGVIPPRRTHGRGGQRSRVTMTAAGLFTSAGSVALFARRPCRSGETGAVLVRSRV
jgi:hypothetical protein